MSGLQSSTEDSINGLAVREQGNTLRNNGIPPLHQLLLALRFYALGTMLNSVADFAGVSLSSACRIVADISTAIARLYEKYVVLHSRTTDKFYNIAQFPRVCGAIDCTHVHIQSPCSTIGEEYRNRKGYFSINVQGVCDADLKLMNVVARWPGSAHDATIFNNSVLRAQCEDGILGNRWLLGDSAYPNRPYLLTPLLNPTTRQEIRYNEAHIKTRNTIERVATNFPHLVSLGTGRLSTAVTLHPIKQGRVTIGSDPTCDIYIYGPGVAAMHCRVESSGGVLTLYPLGGVTMIDQTPATKPLRLEQGCMLTLGRGNYLRFNNPEEAKLMKTVLPVTPSHADYMNNHENLKMSYYPQDKLAYSDSLRKLNDDLDITIKEMCRTKKPPAVPKKPFKEENYESDQETKPKQSSIMAKVNKFEYYAKQQKNVGRSQFYTTHDDEISPKVFSANSLTVNTPAKDVLGGRSLPNYIKQPTVIQDNTRKDYVNVAVKNNTKINHIVRNFDDKLPKKVNNDQQNYGKYNNINVINGLDENMVDNDIFYDSVTSGRYDNMYERSWEAESMRNKAYQDRVKEQAQKEAETARLEEILNMCAEYEKQITSGLPITPTEKRAHNKIITNGSLPRSAAMNNPNFVQTSDGYFKFETSHSRNNTMSQSMPARNVSSYENFDPTNCFSDHKELMNNHNYENIGRMDEIGIPVFDDPKSEISSPILIRKLNQSDSKPTTSSPIGSPYENVNKNLLGFKPKSPNTQSPRTRIKTTFAHRNPTSPQYFVFPTPPPTDNKPNYENYYPDTKFGGIEKQLSLEEEIPMIDDSDVTNDIELRHSKIINDNLDENKEIIQHNDTENNITSIIINKSFDDVKKELMADIPELEEFERDLKESKRNKTTNNNLNIKIIMEHTRKVDVEDKSIDSTNLDENVDELKSRYDNMKEERRKLLSGIHEVKCKMSQIRLHEDDVLRELEMEKALIKGEYDSEIAILNLEQKKRTELAEKVRNVEEEIKALKNRQEARQNEMRERVDIATLKVERLEKDVKDKTATMEELQNAQDILENESKIYEDLEFQHLEEESELLSHREDIQNEMALLTKKIDAQKQRILTLKSEATSNLTSALDETKVLQAEYVRLLNHVEISTTRVQNIEKEIKALTSKLNEIERTQSPDSAFYTDQTRTKSGEFGYSPQSSDSDDLDLAKMGNYIDYSKELKDKLIDQMSQSMIVDIERRFNGNIGDIDLNESPTKLSIGKEKKGFWERNFDSLKRKNKNKKSPEKTDIMTQSLNENMFYNHEIIENENQFDDRFNSLRNSKKEKKDGPIKSSSSSKIPTFSALGKIIKRDSLTRRNRENIIKDEIEPESPKQSYVKQTKPSNSLKYNKAKSLSPEKIKNETENETTPPKTKTKQHRKSCGDEPNTNNETITENNKIPSQDDIDRISKVTMDAPILSSEDLNTLGKKTFDSLMEIERKRMVMLEEQGCQVIENAREKISELKRRAHDETKKLWDQKYKTDQSSLDNNDSNTQETQPRSGLDTRISEYQSRNGEQQSRNGEHQSRNGEHQSRNGEHQSRNGEQQSRNGEHQSRNGEQQSRNGEQQSRIGEQQSKTGLQHYWNQQLRIRDQQCRQEEQQNKFWDQKSRIAEQLIRTGDQRGNDNNTQMDQNESLSWTVFDDPSSGVISSSSIEELQVRNSLTEDEKRSNESRPLSHASDFSRDTLLVSGRWRGASGRQRPLTRYLPVDREDFDLRTHIDSAGHQVELCPHVTVNSSSCRGYLHKLGAKFHTWSKRWFVFDRESKTFVYYWDKSEKKPRGGAYFQVIEEVYLDHGNTSKSPNPQTTFIVKTRQRRYYLMAPSGEAARIWIDVIFTGAQGYTDYLET